MPQTPISQTALNVANVDLHLPWNLSKKQAISEEQYTKAISSIKGMKSLHEILNNLFASILFRYK
jgi:hypothetical protein